MRTSLPFTSLSEPHFKVERAEARQQCWGVALNPVMAFPGWEQEQRSIVELAVLIII